MNIVDRLVQHRMLGAAPREELAWLATHGSVRQLQAGQVLTAKGSQVEGLFVYLVHTMLDRARVFTSSDLHDEKMVSLGKLSAGLAHELNNPASAIERSAALLEARLDESERASRALGASRLTEDQFITA